MIEPSQLSEFGKVFIYMVMGILFVLFTFFLGWLVALKRPNPAKLSSYECGEEPTGSSWIQFNSRFYVVALIFLLFDVEMVFIFPWATIFSQETLLAADSRWGWLTMIEMFIFIGILLIGLMYVWKKGDLNWIKPVNELPVGPGKVPMSMYAKINNDNYIVRKFSLENQVLHDSIIQEDSKPLSVKPAFKPQFKKR
ncbi:NADH-quinone oxidoreductase subunit A [Daejeonella lutea]|uniref:NADH-quinone oxidoreductase subunit A n=1 Tax=Daejeonella lutea TaxID=572036 RepID=A0A1T5AEZ7_9SPHI|nr:NADH-quinone oxidoreductase subunit A [Daejeonella lutea]SKB33223.1 NADH-quinone oxidoreductase subunit A [Daejeonella lutea]